MEITVNGGHAAFQSGQKKWTSHQASMQFIGNFKTGKVEEVKSYRQAGENRPSKLVKPQFSQKERARLHQQAQARFNGILQRKSKKRNKTDDSWIEDIKPEDSEKEPHKQHLCERCHELGVCCVNFTKEVMTFEDGSESAFIHLKKHAKWYAHKNRLRSQGTTTLYHQTSAEAAKKILSSQMMFPGRKGALGGGIYFARTPEETNAKAQSKGVILQCEVQLGNRMVAKQKDRSLCLTRILKKNYDSVVSTPGLFPTGVEYVVYHDAQVVSVKKYKQKRN